MYITTFLIVFNTQSSQVKSSLALVLFIVFGWRKGILHYRLLCNIKLRYLTMSTVKHNQSIFL